MAPLDRPWLSSYSPGVPADVDIPDEPIVAGLDRTVAELPDRVAVDFQGQSLTYRELGRQVGKAAGALLALGVAPGERVAIALPNCTSHVIAFYAALRIGAIVVEHNPLYTASELEYQLRDSGATTVICWDKTTATILSVQDRTDVRTVLSVDVSRDLPLGQRLALHLPIPKARHLRAALCAPRPARTLSWHDTVADAATLPTTHPSPVSTDIALLQYTGGTTGTPKAAVLTHRNLVTNSIQAATWAGVRYGEETIYAILPFFHAFGLTLCAVLSVRYGATLVAFAKFHPEAVLAAQRRRPATFVPGVAPMFDRLARLAQAQHADLSSVRLAFAGAMPISAETARLWEEVTGGLLIEGWGMTETSPFCLGNPCTDARRPGFLGLPFPNTEMRVVDIDDPTKDVAPGDRGELLVRGPQIFAGYWQRPEESAQVLLPDGWLRTGDVVVVEDDGFARLVDRTKEMIVTGGFKVYPSQVEDRLRLMPGVADVAVVGLPGGDLGEKVVAAVVLAAGATGIDLAAIRDWGAEHLARYALPRELVILTELPRSAIGKVMRRVVRDQLVNAAAV